MAPKTTLAVIGVQIQNIQDDVTEIKSDVKDIKIQGAEHETRIAVLESSQAPDLTPRVTALEREKSLLVKIFLWSLGTSGLGGVAYAGLKLLG